MDNIFIIKADDFSIIKPEKKNHNEIKELKELKALYKEALDKLSVYDSINNTRIDEFGIYKEDGNYKTTGFIGINWLRDSNGDIITVGEGNMEVAICVDPRFKKIDQWEMLTTVLSGRKDAEFVSDYSDRFFEIFFDRPIWAPVDCKGGELLLIISFLHSLQALCRKKITYKMKKFEKNFNGSVHGNIKLQKHIIKNISQGREDRVYCEYSSFTIDTIENRILKRACVIARTILQENNISVPEISNMLNFCLYSLGGVSLVDIKRSDFANVDISGFNSKYKEPITLARSLIEHIALNTDKSSETMHYILPYAIKMEALFEFYIRTKFKEFIENGYPGYRIDDYRMQGDSSGLRVYNSCEELYLLKEYIPDIVIQKEKNENGIISYENVVVLDVKYQHCNDYNAISRRQNSHQLLAYAFLLSVKKCGFIFPYDGKDKNGKEKNGKSVVLNIQEGNVEKTIREYSQWMIDNMDMKNLDDFFANMITELLA